jgi:hypothetical protein
MICDGSLTIDTMGFLKHLEQQTKHSVIWTSGGAASLIVFLKCLGFTYDQIIENLLKLDSLTSLMFGGCIEMNASKDIEEDLNDWFNHIFASKKLFNKDITLKEIYKMTKIFPNFIVYDDTIMSLNPASHPDVKLKDGVLASLTNFGSLEYHIMDDVKYTSFSVHDPYPIDQNFTLNDDSKTLYIANYSIPTHIPYSYLETVQNSLQQIYFDRVKQRVKDNLDVALINGYTNTMDIEDYDKTKCLENGKTHAQMFLNGDDTRNKMMEMVERIKNQS